VTSASRDPSITILIADATAMVCELLKSAFKRRPKYVVKACATTLEDIQRIAQRENINVPLIGTHLANGPFTGIQAVQQLRTVQPKSRSVLLCEGPQSALVVEAFRAGAKGVFQRSEQGFEDLCKCISRVHAGEIWASSKQLEAVMEALVRTAPLRLVGHGGMNLLSKREDEIVRLVTAGANNREIAAQLGLSQHTVKNYLFKIFDKVGVSSRVELVLYAMHMSKHSDSDIAGKFAS
jgi:DNA-binding NarL/FixJ family response regulator